MKRKKALLFLYTYIIMMVSPKIHAAEKITYNIEYNIEYDNLYARFQNKNIYIEQGKNSSKIIDNNPQNIHILDDRSNHNPDIKIYNSHNITNIEDMLKILQIIKTYEEEFPSKWNRSTKSMTIEWIIHNICYQLNIEQERTKTVDFDNKEETKYLNLINSLYEIISNHINYETEQNNNLIKKKTY